MAFEYARLTEIMEIPNTIGVLYTNPASTQSYIRLIIIHNTNVSAERVILYNVPDVATTVGAASPSNIFYSADVESDETVFIEFPAPGLILSDQNDTIQAVTTTSNEVTVQITGGIE